MPSQTHHGVHVTIHMITFFCSEYFGYMALGLFICIWPHLVFWTILILLTSKLTENTFFQGKNCALMIVQYDWGNGDIGSRWHFLWLDIFFGREIGVNTILEWMPISPLLDFISPTRHLEICLLFFTPGSEQKSYRGFVLIFQIVICSLFQITFLRSFRGPYGCWTILACITFGPSSA